MGSCPPWKPTLRLIPLRCCLLHVSWPSPHAYSAPGLISSRCGATEPALVVADRELVRGAGSSSRRDGRCRRRCRAKGVVDRGDVLHHVLEQIEGRVQIVDHVLEPGSARLLQRVRRRRRTGSRNLLLYRCQRLRQSADGLPQLVIDRGVARTTARSTPLSRSRCSLARASRRAATDCADVIPRMSARRAFAALVMSGVGVTDVDVVAGGQRGPRLTSHSPSCSLPRKPGRRASLAAHQP